MAADITVKTIEELAFYDGPHALSGIKFRYASKGLGFEAWDLNVLDLDPDATSYPEHDHVEENATEVYVILKGSGRLKAGTEELPIQAGMLIRVGPGQKRKFIAGPDGLSILAI